MREEIGRHIVGHQQLVERLALIGTRHLARDLFPGSLLLRVLLTGPPMVPSREPPVVVRRGGRMLPSSGSCNVAKMRISVDLPAPLGPIKLYIPTGIVSVTPFSACTPLE